MTRARRTAHGDECGGDFPSQVVARHPLTLSFAARLRFGGQRFGVFCFDQSRIPDFFESLTLKLFLEQCFRKLFRDRGVMREPIRASCEITLVDLSPRILSQCPIGRVSGRSPVLTPNLFAALRRDSVVIEV